MLAVGLVMALGSSSWGGQAKTRVVSRKKSGALANGSSSQSVISADGRYVAFRSEADNLGGNPNFDNVFRKNLETGGVRLVSRTRGGEAGDADSSGPSISASGRYVGFGTEAGNLPGDDNYPDVVVKDMETGRVILASRTSGGDPANGNSFDPSISGSGRFVAFASQADNLGGDPGETNVFVHDLQTRRTRLASKTSGGEAATGGGSSQVAISGSGRYVAFASSATNLPGAAAGDDQIYVHDRTTGNTRLASKTSGGDPADGDSQDPSMSAGGRSVAFESRNSTNLPGQGSGSQTYVHDRRTGNTRLVSKTTGGDPVDGDSEDPSLSASGRYVAFESQNSTNLPGATSWNQVYRHDRETRRTILLSKSNTGDPADDFAGVPTGERAITANGAFVVFESGANNLGGGSTYNHIYRRGPLG
jgi:Tol biopolymer transport system component